MVMEWNEQDEAERNRNRDSKSTQCEYAVHRYESGLLNLWRYLEHRCLWAWCVWME